MYPNTNHRLPELTSVVSWLKENAGLANYVEEYPEPPFGDLVRTEIDWSDVLTVNSEILKDAAFAGPDAEWNVRSKVAELLNPELLPEARSTAEGAFERIAWYAPITFYAEAAGIYVLESGFAKLAANYADHFIVSGISQGDSIKDGILLAWATLMEHEIFHHEVESWAIAHHVITGQPVYQTYHEKVYRPAANPFSDDLIEEALASAREIIFARSPRGVFKEHGSQRALKESASSVMATVSRRPPGYRLGTYFRDRRLFQDVSTSLARQIVDPNQPSFNGSRDFTPPIAVFGKRIVPSFLRTVTILRDRP